MEWEKISADNATNKDIISKLYQQLIQLSNKKQTLWKDGQRDFPGGPVIKISCSNAHWGAKIPHVAWPKNQNTTNSIKTLKQWSILKKKKLKKWVDLNRYFFKEDTEMKRYLTLLIIRETQIRTTMYHLTLVRMAAIRKSTNNKLLETVWRKGTLFTLLVGI